MATGTIKKAPFNTYRNLTTTPALTYNSAVIEFYGNQDPIVEATVVSGICYVRVDLFKLRNAQNDGAVVVSGLPAAKAASQTRIIGQDSSTKLLNSAYFSIYYNSHDMVVTTYNGVSNFTIGSLILSYPVKEL